MALSEQTAARLVGFDELGAQMQISTLTAIEAPGAPVPRVGVGSREDGRADT